MKRLLLSTVAIALISGTAYAADLPAFEAPAPVEVVAPTPVATWSGVYLGIHGGYGWGAVDRDGGDDDDDIDFDFDDNADVEGGIIGGQVGINWQFDSFVLGAEADASAFFTEDDDADFDDDGGNGNRNNDWGAEAYWLASARLRAGIGFDRVLLYGTGGVGFAEFETEREGGGGGGGSNDDDDGEVEIGWVAGGGAEFLLTDNVTIGAEYLHYEFGDIGDGGGNNRDDDDFDFGDINADVDVIRGRVNVKFGSLFGG